MSRIPRFTSFGALLISSSIVSADLIYGLDAVVETSGPANDATFNEFTSAGLNIANPKTVTSWISATASGGQAVKANFNSNAANITINGPAESYAVTVSIKVDLVGSHMVDFDKFAFSAQRAGGGTGNVISDAGFSTDGQTYTPVLVEEVAVGGNGGGNNVGPADTITDFRTPNGLGGSISPQQTYVISGLGAAGTLSSGSFYLRFTIGESTTTPGGFSLFNDRFDLTTEAMNLATANTTDLGEDDGYDMAWFGTSTPVNTIWTGASNVDWSEISNWVDEIPSDEQGAAFFTELSEMNLDTNLDQQMTIPALIVSDPAGPVSIGGEGALTIGAGGINTTYASQELTITAQISFDADQAWTIGNIVNIESVLVGSGNLIRRGAGGLLNLKAANTFTGEVLLENVGGSGYNGILGVLNVDALGDVATGTTVHAGARVLLSEALEGPVLEPLVLFGNGGDGNPGALSSTVNDHTWAGPISLASSARIKNNTEMTTLTLDTSITGVDVDLTLDGVGNHEVTQIVSLGTGRLIKAGSGSATIVNGNLYGGDTALVGGTLIVGGEAIPDTSKLIINNDAKIQVTGIEIVESLFFGGDEQISGTWGATGSGAANIDDARFAGTDGVIQALNGVTPPRIIVTSVAGGPAGFTVEWTYEGGAVDIYRSTNFVNWLQLDDDNSTLSFLDSTAPNQNSFYVLVPTGTTFPME